jgi:predicted ribosomally synthesized peptide with SipW-like signal peptide
MKSKMIISLMIIAMVAALIGGATMAWFTDDAAPGEATFTAGTVIIDAAFNDDVQVVEGEYVFEENWNPGDTTKVCLTITNDGSKAMVFKLTPTFEIDVHEDYVELWDTNELEAWAGQNIL